MENRYVRVVTSLFRTSGERSEEDEMTIEEIKQEISRRTGVPTSFLYGETLEENVALAKAVLLYRKEKRGSATKTTREQFAEWFSGSDEVADRTEEAMSNLEEFYRASFYPQVDDKGEVANMPEGRPASEQFAEWFGNKTAFDPFSNTEL